MYPLYEMFCRIFIGPIGLQHDRLPGMFFSTLPNTEGSELRWPWMSFRCMGYSAFQSLLFPQPGRDTCLDAMKAKFPIKPVGSIQMSQCLSILVSKHGANSIGNAECQSHSTDWFDHCTSGCLAADYWRISFRYSQEKSRWNSSFSIDRKLVQRDLIPNQDWYGKVSNAGWTPHL